MKQSRISFIGLIVGIVCFFGVFAYFVGGVSATYPPIKTYDYTLTDKELHKELLNVVSNNQTWTFKINDSTGQINDRRYYCELYKRTPTDSLTFSIFFQKADRLFDKETKSEIGLVQAWDNIQWTGGYKMDDPHVKDLVKLFETEIISGLQSNTSR